MHKFFNLLMITSLVLGQFAMPGMVRAAEPIVAAESIVEVETNSEIAAAQTRAAVESESASTAPISIREEAAIGTPVPPARVAVGTPAPEEILKTHPAQKSGPSLRLWTDPEKVTSNASFDLHWEVNGVAYDGLALLRISLPAGVSSEEKRREGEYDEITGMFTLTQAITEAEGTLRLRADNLVSA